MTATCHYNSYCDDATVMVVVEGSSNFLFFSLRCLLLKNGKIFHSNVTKLQNEFTISIYTLKYENIKSLTLSSGHYKNTQ